MATPRQFTKQYTNSDCPVTFGAQQANGAAAALPNYISVTGSGSVVVTNEDDSTASFTCNGGEVFEGAFKVLTSMTTTRVVMGSGTPPAPAPGGVNVQAVNLAGGAGSVTGVLPSTNKTDYTEDSTIHNAAFTAVLGTVHYITATGATYAYTLPAINTAAGGQRIAICNVGAGTTATVATGTGTDSIGATTAASITAAGPTGGNTKVYTASNTNKCWLTGI